MTLKYVSILLLLALLCTGLSSADAAGRFLRGFRRGGRGGKGGGGGRNFLIYNITLAANLTDASSKAVGHVDLDLFYNNKTSDYDLSYRTHAQVASGDSLTSSLVLLTTTTIFNITNPTNGFHLHRGRFGSTTNISETEGRFFNLSTLTTNGGTYLDAVKAIIAAPSTYTAQVLSTALPAGYASGPFEAVVRTPGAGGGKGPGGRGGGGGGKGGKGGHGRGFLELMSIFG